jgi:hypothetical protein
MSRANGRAGDPAGLLEGAGHGADASEHRPLNYLAGQGEPPGRDRGRAGLALISFGRRPVSVDEPVEDGRRGLPARCRASWTTTRNPTLLLKLSGWLLFR